MPISYVGKDPTNATDSSVVTKGWADTYNGTVVVTSSWVNSTIATEAANDSLENQAYVDQQDALRAHKTDVDAADQNYVPASVWAQPNGVAQLDTSGDLLASEVPSGVPLSRSALVYTAASDGTVFLGPGQSHQCSTQTYREFQLATIPIPDPGYMWRPLCFAIVGGYSNGGGVPADKTTGTGNMGLVSVIPPAGVSDVIFAAGSCTALYQELAFYPVIPSGANGQTPVNVPAITGPLELGLWACCLDLTGYVFVGDGLFYQVQVIPAM